MVMDVWAGPPSLVRPKGHTIKTKPKQYKNLLLCTFRSVHRYNTWSLIHRAGTTEVYEYRTLRVYVDFPYLQGVHGVVKV